MHCASGGKSLTTGLKSSASLPYFIAARCARPLARSCSVSTLLNSVMEKFLVCWRTQSGPVTKTPDHEGSAQGLRTGPSRLPRRRSTD